MNKIRKIITAIRNLIHQPSLINLIAKDENGYRRYIDKKYNNLANLPIIGIDQILPKSGIMINSYSFLGGGSLITDLALIKAICLKYEVKDYLEFGTWRGESVSAVAEVVQNCTTVNIPDVEMCKAGLSQEYIDAHRYYSKGLRNVKHIQANTLDLTTDSFEGNKYDLIFIDADHHYESVLSDTRLAFSLLKNESSIIVWHDYAFDPIHVRDSVFAAILDGTPETCRSSLIHVSNTLCAVYLPHQLKSDTESLSYIPRRNFTVTILPDRHY